MDRGSRYTGGHSPVTHVVRDSRYTGGHSPITKVVRLPLHRWSDSRCTSGQTPVTQVDRDSRYTGGQAPVTQLVRNSRYLENEKVDRLAKEAARSENMQHVFDRIPKSISHHKAEEAKQEWQTEWSTSDKASATKQRKYGEISKAALLWKPQRSWKT